jgi:hypothetical protein
MDSVCGPIGNPQNDPAVNATCYDGSIVVKDIHGQCAIANKFFGAIISEPVSATLNCHRESKTCRFECMPDDI